MSDLNRKNKNELRKQKIRKEIQKLKVFKQKCKAKLTVQSLKAMKGFENLSDEMAEKVIEQLRELGAIIIKQLNREKKIKSYE
ncbi:MAG: hypothetical protein H6582_13430 [Crocinitomicaceae bacterium]|nr:hypothetical protein [Crocinitomicaceae bacterium]